ncbi:hypothetical protein FB567DRAFT_543411 [Paraphoma chrysanthemicola]|uniref:Uncharacterized protein n=1 Tax=Paraphoma chrysanthemicola TaxID=798071 RepID=A0A8K0W4L8_9PLEO|nr:hypothetical protein FB567DRAFT_543411 [Paraphoma chrysanthemicola]
MCPNHNVHPHGDIQPETRPELTYIRIIEAEARLAEIEAEKLQLEKSLQRYREIEAIMAERRAERERIWQQLQEALERDISRQISGADGFHDDEWRQSSPPSHLRGGGRRRGHSMSPTPPSFTGCVHHPPPFSSGYPAYRAESSTLDLSPPSSLIYPTLRPASPHLHHAYGSPGAFRAPPPMTEPEKAMLKRTIANIESEEQTLEAQKQSLRNILKEETAREKTRTKKSRKDIKGKNKNPYVRDEKDEEAEEIQSQGDWAFNQHGDDEYDKTTLESDTDSDLGYPSRPPSRVHTWRPGYGPGTTRRYSPAFEPAVYDTSSHLDHPRHVHHHRSFSPSFTHELGSQARFLRPLSPPRYASPLPHHHNRHSHYSSALQHERNALASSIARAETDIMLAEINRSDAEMDLALAEMELSDLEFEERMGDSGTLDEQVARMEDVDELRAKVSGLRWSLN